MSVGILVVERESYLTRLEQEGFPTRKRGWKPAIEISASAVLSRYRGVDGAIWPAKPDRFTVTVNERAVASLEDLEKCRRLKASLPGELISDLIAIGETDNSINDPRVAFVGYDVGHVSFGRGAFSCILHECVYGTNDVLRSYAKHLNQALLFDNRGIAEFFLSQRSEAAWSSPGDFEDDLDPLRVIAVYEPTDMRAI